MDQTLVSATDAVPKSPITLSVVVPVYNEREVILATHERLTRVLGASEDFRLEIVYINDGSKDGTEAILYRLAESSPQVRVISFSRNFGHQPAVSAGIAQASGDAVAVIDADLQDPPEVILQMLSYWRGGFQVVYGIRKKRKEPVLLRLAYAGFYRLYRSLSDIEVPMDSGDFCLLDRKVVDVINSLPEKNRFMRGLRSWTGFRQHGLEYDRESRAAGVTKYNLARLTKLAFDGIVNFSTAPLRLVFLVGAAMFVFSNLALILVVVQRLTGISLFGMRPTDVPGWTSVILALLVFSSVQMLSLGIFGEYLGRMYQEIKRRPEYVIKDVRGYSETLVNRGYETVEECVLKEDRASGA